jgi:hypothetical protein
MTRLLAAGVAALAMMTGVALAQTSSQVTTSVVPQVVAPPAGTLSVTRSQNTTGPDGTRSNTNETTYRKGNGVADDSVTTTTRPPPPLVTTTTKSTTTVTE